MRRSVSKSGFTMVELMVVCLLMSIILTAGSMVFISGQQQFTETALQSELQDNLVRALDRVTFELKDSGTGPSGLQVSIQDNLGVNGTDILTFSIPVCICGASPIDTAGDVSRWGAPMVWGQNGCAQVYVLDAQGKIDVCHTPINGNAHTLNISENAIPAHLAHGDYVGVCGVCDPDVYSNKFIEYMVDGNNYLLRKVLGSDGSVLASVVMASKISGFQAVLNNAQTAVSLTVATNGTGTQKRAMTLTNTMDVRLRNGG